MEKQQAALAYAQKGWAVFPCKPHDKVPATAHGYKDATTDPEQITKWWSENPEYNIGIACGAVSGIFVIDVDNKPTSNTIYIPKETLTATTGGGGRHYVFSFDEFAKAIGTTAKKLAGNVDTRSDGGYIVAPPSVHPNGTLYEWDNDLPITPIPEDFKPTILSRLSKPVGNPVCAVSEIIPEGERNDTLFRTACMLREKGLSWREIRGTIEIVNNDRCVPPLDDGEIDGIVDQATKYAAGQLPIKLTNSLLKDPLKEPKTNGPLWIPDIPDDPDPMYLWDELIAKGEATLFCGDHKIGKTSLLAWVLKWTRSGGAFLRPVNKCRVLIVTEEHRRMWKKRAAKLDGVAKWAHICVWSKPFAHLSWLEIVEQVSEFVTDNHIDLVVIDTLARMAQLKDENSNAEMNEALRQGEPILAAGAAVLYIHHASKQGAKFGKSARGASSLLGAVETIIEVRRNSDDINDTKRSLEILSRNELTQQQYTVSFDKVTGEYNQVDMEDIQFDRDNEYLCLLPECAPGATAKDVASHWDGAAPALRTVQTRLKDLYNQGRINRSGKGGKVDEFRYYRKSISTPIDL